jgi:hypothetical protein
MTLQVCDGDLLDQDVEVIVNAWNRTSSRGRRCCPQGVTLTVQPEAAASGACPEIMAISLHRMIKVG